jgi:hypothetical protein
MSEPHAEPPGADVRSFLPRPGEPVEDYAARLRALHDDLSLVLDAVERGLAAADAEPAPPRPVEAVPEPHRSPPPPGPLAAPRGSARVEVISTPATARGQAGGGRAWSGPPPGPEGTAPPTGRRAPTGEGAPARGEPAVPSPGRWQPDHGAWVERPPRPVRSEPWVDHPGAAAWAEAGAEHRAASWPQPPAWPQGAGWPEGGTPAWPERGTSAWPPAEASFGPYAAPPRRRGPSLPPLFVAAAILGWLTALALGLALAFGT